MNPAAKLARLVATESPRHILVIGESMTDVYIHGEAETCQDDCVKLVEKCRVTRPGGAANAAHSLSNWRVNVVCPSIPYQPVKTRYIVDGVIVFRHDMDMNRVDVDAHRLHYEKVIRGCLPLVDAVLISDYDKGLLTTDFLKTITDICDDRAVPCVADAKRGPATYGKAIIKANGTWGVKYHDVWDKRGYIYVETHGAGYPSVWIYNEWEPSRIPDLPPVRCINHVGAGDCFAAHLTLALAYGLSLKDAAALAHSAGRVYASRPHNRPPIPGEIVVDVAAARV